MTAGCLRSRRGITVEQLSEGALNVGQLVGAAIKTGGSLDIVRAPLRLRNVRRIQASKYLVRVDFIAARTPQTIRVSWTRCHLGGARPWLHCPCGRRVGKLLPGLGGFFCRKCVGNPVYACQSTSTAGRKHYAAAKLRLQLQGTASLLEPLPGKPPKMHWATFQRLRAKLEALEGELSPRARARNPDYPNLVISARI